jgi:SAM-dependent methyltransferase
VSVSAEQVEAGQAVYSRSTLVIYDWLVLGVSNRFIWKCPTPGLEAHYDKHLSANHLDVGVGTGYFLDRCRFSVATPRVALMDLNPNALAFTAQRIARYKPETYRRNVLEPIPFDAARFDSVGVNYLLHCIPGTIASKAVAFDHLKALMNPNAVLFGSTLLQGGVQRSGLAKRLMAVYNKKGIFANEHDDLEGLQHALSSRFRDVSVQVVGCCAVFSARV